MADPAIMQNDKEKNIYSFLNIYYNRPLSAMKFPLTVFIYQRNDNLAVERPVNKCTSLSNDRIKRPFFSFFF